MNICRDLREALGYTVTELARKASMGTPTVTMIEGGMNVSERTWIKLADFFKVSVPELKGEAELDVDRWIKQVTEKVVAEEPINNVAPVEEQLPEALSKPVGLYQLNIQHVIKVSTSAVNHYLQNGWILLDTMSKDGVFYCLVGNTKFYHQEDFDKMKGLSPKRPTAYWMER